MGGRGKRMFQMETDMLEQVCLSAMASSRVRQLVTVSESHLKPWEMAPSDELMTYSAPSTGLSLGP